jgi:hypothetical protein
MAFAERQLVTQTSTMPTKPNHAVLRHSKSHWHMLHPNRASAHLQKALCSCALDAADGIQRLAVPLPPTDVRQHIVAGLQPLHQQAVVGQCRKRGGALDLQFHLILWTVLPS